MIRYLRGMVISKSRNQLIIDVGGVGYAIFVTPTTLTQTALDSMQVFHVSESIREDAHDLFGFSLSEERDTFEILRKVSGVGPKVALAILGFYTCQELNRLISQTSVAKLSLVPGVGKKLAEKIIVELKGKTDLVDLSQQEIDLDIVEALQSLGFNRGEIAGAVKNIPADLVTTESKVAWVLRYVKE